MPAMKFTLQGTKYFYDPDRLSVKVSAEAERRFGLTSTEIRRGMLSGSARAFLALVWAIKTAAGEKVDPDELDFCYADLTDAVLLDDDGNPVTDDGAGDEAGDSDQAPPSKAAGATRPGRQSASKPSGTGT